MLNKLFGAVQFVQDPLTKYGEVAGQRTSVEAGVGILPIVEFAADGFVAFGVWVGTTFGVTQVLSVALYVFGAVQFTHWNVATSR